MDFYFNNIEKFDEDFRFQLTKYEWEFLRSKFSTSKLETGSGGRRYLPLAFTEQGIYMLMTVLKGELDIRQSKALIRTFKQMKDYIVENQGWIGPREVPQPASLVPDAVDRVARAVSGPYAKRIVVSHNRAPAVSHHVAEKLGFVTSPLGSAGAKAMHVLIGDYDAYIHAGGQYEWDSAAPVGVCKAAGLHCSRLDGSELLYNNKDTYMPDILICRPELADDILEMAATFRQENGSY